jgi:hypothetical protein
MRMNFPSVFVQNAFSLICYSYQTTCSSIVGALSVNLESNVVRSVRLDLKGGSAEVVEIFVEQLIRCNISV